MTSSTPRILMAAHAAEATGAPRVLADLARACHAAGWDVTVMMPGSSAFERELIEAGITLHHIYHPAGAVPWRSPPQVPAALMKRMGYYRAWRRWLQGRSFDIAYISASVEVLRGMACANAGIPLCWHVHEDLPVAAPPLLRRKINLIKRHSRLILYAAEACRRAFQPVPSSVTEAVLWNGINLLEYERHPDAEERRTIRHELGVDDDEWLICTAALAQPRKGIDVAVETMRRLRDEFAGPLARPVRWLVLGDWHASFPDYQSLVTQQIQVARLTEQFQVVGFRKDLPRVFAAADAFVLPSRNEAMPLVLCEAMAAGLPVISTDTGDVRAMLDDGALGWIAPVENPRALAEAITAALTNDDERRRRAVAARRRAFEQFSLETVREKFLRLIEQHFLK